MSDDTKHRCDLVRRLSANIIRIDAEIKQLDRNKLDLVSAKRDFKTSFDAALSELIRENVDTLSRFFDLPLPSRPLHEDDNARAPKRTLQTAAPSSSSEASYGA